MERFIIGHSRHGKTLTSRPDLDELVSYEEIFDAMAVLSLLAAREIRRDRSSPNAEQLTRESNKLAEILASAGLWEAQMEVIGAKTSFDICAYAVRLLCPEFRE